MQYINEIYHTTFVCEMQYIAGDFFENLDRFIKLKSSENAFFYLLIELIIFSLLQIASRPLIFIYLFLFDFSLTAIFAKWEE